jgi:hypothetical protein
MRSPHAPLAKGCTNRGTDPKARLTPRASARTMATKGAWRGQGAGERIRPLRLEFLLKLLDLLLCHRARRAQLAHCTARRLGDSIVVVLVKKVGRVVNSLLGAALLPELRELDIVHVVLARHGPARIYPSSSHGSAQGFPCAATTEQRRATP